MVHRCAILDDYQNVALKMADWSPVQGELEIKVFNEPLGDLDNVIGVLGGYEIVCLMRERTPFPRRAFEELAALRLLITTGARNNSIDLPAAKERNVTVCGTPSVGNPTTGIAIGLMLELTRRIGFENTRMKAGAAWQVTVGSDLEGKVLGIVGLGKLGQRVAGVCKAFGMQVIAWSQNLTAEKCREAGVNYASKEELFSRADIVSVHLQLSPRSRGLIGAADLGRMKPTAYVINTARAPIIDSEALLAALREHRIAGAGLDVFDTEPLPRNHPLRSMDNVVLTPHLGYVTQENYRAYFAGIVEDIRGWLDGKPVRVLS